MKKILTLLSVFLIFFSSTVLAQEEPLPTPLPTVIIKGKDRSYLEIIRPPKLSYMSLRGEKSKKRVPLKIILLPQVRYNFVFSSLAVKPIKIAPVRVKKEVSPPSISKPVFSQSYISYEKVSISPKKERVVFFKKSGEGKELIQPPVEVVFLPQKSFPLTFYPIEKKPLKIVLTPSKKEVYSSPFEVAFSPPVSSFEPSSPGKKIEPSKEKSFRKLKERKGIIQPPLEIPLIKKISHSEQIKKSPLPYLHLSSSLGNYGEFNYKLNYGRELNTTNYLLALERNSYPLWNIHENETTKKIQNLSKEDDRFNLGINWKRSGESKWEVVVEGYQEKLEFSDKERKQTKVFLQPNWELLREKNIFKLSGWIETVEGSDQPATGATTKWEDTTVGARVEMQMRDSPVSLGITGDWESLKGNYNRQKDQIYLWGKHSSLFSGKDIAVSLEGGAKGIKNEPTEFLPSLRVNYRFKPSWKLNLEVEKKFYLPQFSELYLSRDYVDINEILTAVNIWDYQLRLEYHNLPKTNISLEGFHSNGKGIVWSWDGDKNKPENVNLNQWGWKFELTHYFSPSFKQELIFVSQKTENLDDPGKKITHSPHGSGQLWLKWEKNGWAVAVGGEWIGKRYYNLEDSSKKLPAGWKGRFKFSRKKENWEVFTELELNDYHLWGLGDTKYYKLPKQRISLGINVKLF